MVEWRLSSSLPQGAVLVLDRLITAAPARANVSVLEILLRHLADRAFPARQPVELELRMAEHTGRVFHRRQLLSECGNVRTMPLSLRGSPQWGFAFQGGM